MRDDGLSTAVARRLVRRRLDGHHAAAARLARELGPGPTIVILLCDAENKYLGRLFNPAFLASKGIAGRMNSRRFFAASLTRIGKTHSASPVRSLRDELDDDLTRDHLPLRLGIGADVRNDESSHELGVDQSPDANAWTRHVVGDNGEVIASLSQQFADQTVRRPDAHEAAVHSDDPSGIFSTTAERVIALCMGIR